MESFYKHWCDNGSDYVTGVEFYSRHGSSDTLKHLFASGENSFTKRKLSDELEKLQHIATQPATNNRTKAKLLRDKLPPHLQTEYDRLGELIRKMSYLHPQLSVVKSKIDRANISAEILSYAEARRVIFNRLDHFAETGQDLLQVNEKASESEKKEASPLEQKEELLRLKVQRSKLKKKPNRVNDYNIVVTRIAELEKELKK